MGDLRERSLVRLAKKCEDAASGLHAFRDQLPRYANGITGSVGRLFDISSQLQEIDQAQGDQRYAALFYLIQNDLAVLRPTLEGTLDTVFEMFGSTRDRSYPSVWENFVYRMDQDEGIDLFARLGWYQEFLKVLFEELTGQPGEDPSDLRRALVQLTARQEDAVRRLRRRSADNSGMSSLAQGNEIRLNVEQHRSHLDRTKAARGCLAKIPARGRPRRQKDLASLTLHPYPLQNRRLPSRYHPPSRQALRRPWIRARLLTVAIPCRRRISRCIGLRRSLTAGTRRPTSMMPSSCIHSLIDRDAQQRTDSVLGLIAPNAMASPITTLSATYSPTASSSRWKCMQFLRKTP